MTGVQTCALPISSDNVVRDRLSSRSDAPDIISDARFGDFDLLDSRYEAPDSMEDDYHFLVASDRSVEGTTHRILKRLVQIC